MNSMNKKMKRYNISNKTESSNWLMVIPMYIFKYVLNKQQVWELLYGWPIPDLPASCSCEESFNVQHAMSCKKGGFITLRHNEVRFRRTAKIRCDLTFALGVFGWLARKHSLTKGVFPNTQGTQNRLWSNVIPLTKMKRNVTKTTE